MYKQVKTVDKITMENGSTVIPVVSMKSEHDGEAHWIIDDHCYVLILHNKSDRGFFYCTHIFKEAFEILKTLPIPDEAFWKSFEEVENKKER